MSAKSQRLITEAMKWPPLIGPAPHGVDHLMKMYQETAPNVLVSIKAPWPPPVRDAIRKALSQGMWINRAARNLQEVGTYDQKKGIHWCGIFATWMLRKSGVMASWTSQGMTAPGVLTKTSASLAVRQSISDGDICVSGSNQHHFIVIGQIGPERLLTVEGNVGKQEVLRREQKRYDPQIHTVYKLN